MSARYTCWGSVRGTCGILHRSIDTAQAHVERDRASCASLGGGAYSDRDVYTATADGRPDTWCNPYDGDDEVRS